MELQFKICLKKGCTLSIIIAAPLDNDTPISVAWSGRSKEVPLHFNSPIITCDMIHACRSLFNELKRVHIVDFPSFLCVFQSVF